MDAQLKSKGWFLTNEGLDLCKEGLVNPSVDTLIQRALDLDLRLLSSGNHDEANKGKTDAVQGPLIVQIQKIRNVAAPKLNEESNYAPKLLRIQLTDGNTAYSGLLLHTIPKIDMNTAPGTKLLIKGRLLLKQGLMLLDQNNTKVLGGHVDEMVERWKLAKKLSQFTRAIKVEGAPPPWVPFGQRKNMAASHRNDHSGKGGKKSLETNQKDLTETDKAFEEQRKAAIQEVGKHQSKKFGGGKSSAV
ncbi:putative tudor domain-containing protein 3 [Apostichopus japonicus]|uniref:Putative tudor domain-containing protein 3 n=1 Tax=Stichopus japonicus TaxID=307972 RepID=A0A2G8K0P0_STIJA|nr:putative tudor domain-containing protein 3 [Apostichopus japonicus]